jgi:hypothetical protein
MSGVLGVEAVRERMELCRISAESLLATYISGMQVHQCSGYWDAVSDLLLHDAKPRKLCILLSQSVEVVLAPRADSVVSKLQSFCISLLDCCDCV